MKISVIIPIYNIEDYLERCVRSVQAQTYSDLEILLVDDGSTDGTAELVDRLAESDSRTKAFHKENGGSSSARNLGIKQASGDYFGFVDSDDYIEPDMYEKLANMISENNLQIASVSRDEISEDGSRREDVCVPPTEAIKVSSKDFLRELLLHKGDCSFCTKLVDAKLFSDKSFPEGELNEDFRLLVNMLAEVDEIGILPEQAYHVFYREGSNTRRKDRNDFSRVFTDIVVNADRVDGIVKEHYPDLDKYSERFGLVQRLDYILHIPISQMRSDNEFYMSVKQNLRKNRKEIKSNPYLNNDQRKKLMLFATAPKTVRRIHYLSMVLRGKN